VINNFDRRLRDRTGLVWACLPIAIATMLAAPLGSSAGPQPAGKNKPAEPAKSPAPTAAAPAPKPAGNQKVQVVVLAKPGTTKDGLKESVGHAGGTVVSSTTDGTNTFYLVEIDQDKSDESIKTLSKDKNLRSVSINRRH
jgi:hypothetical protein